MTGEHQPTCGDITVNGYSVKTKMGKVRHMLGYCPQFDAIVPLMTGRENLFFFARIKGIGPDKIENVVNTLVRKMDLSDHENRLAGTYSGGNKRKLSVAIALVGNPPIVMLDEPSTGMDPHAKRFMWSVIADTMADRCLVLTSHSMEECEALCNTIGIMADGQLKCIGSPQHLKSRFGEGYQLQLKFTESTAVKSAVQDFVFSTFPSATNEAKEETPSRLCFSIKKDVSLADIFRRVLENKDRLSLTDYSVSQSTLEQVFMRFADHATSGQPEAPQLQSNPSAEVVRPDVGRRISEV